MVSPELLRQLQTVARDRRAVNPRNIFAHRKIVDQVAGFEIVGGVEDQVDIFEQFCRVGGAQIGDEGLQNYVGIDLRQTSGGGDGFGSSFTGIGLGKEELAL